MILRKATLHEEVFHLAHKARLQRLWARHIGEFEPDEPRVLEEKLHVGLRERSEHALNAFESGTIETSWTWTKRSLFKRKCTSPMTLLRARLRVYRRLWTSAAIGFQVSEERFTLEIPRIIRLWIRSRGLVAILSKSNPIQTEEAARPHLNDVELVDFTIPWKQGLAVDELSHDATDRPDINRSVVSGRPKQQLGSPVPPEPHNYSEHKQLFRYN